MIIKSPRHNSVICLSPISMTNPTFMLSPPLPYDSDTQNALSGKTNSSNLEYSLIYQEIKSFLKQCKDSINRYIQLNQFGPKFNMFKHYAQMINMETTTLTDFPNGYDQQFQPQKSLKISYEKQFEDILGKMKTLIKDFINFEISFKQDYFSTNIKQAQVMTDQKCGQNKPNKSSIFKKISRLSSSRSSFYGDCRQSCKYLNEQKQRKTEGQLREPQFEQKLREILNRKLTPQKQNMVKFCDKESEPLKNMQKLEQKIDIIQSEMNLIKTREQKIIEIFNKRRIENIQPRGHGLKHSQLMETGSGQGISGNNEIQKSRIVQSQFEENSGQLKKKKSKFVKPSLDIEIVNQGMQGGEKMNKNDKIGARQLISPRVLRSPRQRNLSSWISFLCSPKNKTSRKVDSPCQGLRVKKKIQLQFLQSTDNKQNTNIMSVAVQGKVQKDKQHQEYSIKGRQITKMAQINNSLIQGGQDGGVKKNNSNEIHKMREPFFRRQKSNNQIPNCGF